MIANFLAYEEMANFIATLNPNKVLEIKPSEAVQRRVEILIDKKKNNTLTPDEQYELDRYMALEHLVALAKIQARKRLAV